MRNLRIATDRWGRAGFSMLEISIAVLLVSILVAIAVPTFIRIRAKSRIREAQGQVEILASALQRLAWDTGNWPGGQNRGSIQNDEVWDLTTSSAGLITGDATKFPNWKGPYVRSIPLDPWGKPYFFDPDYTSGGRTLPVVGSFGPNGVGRNVYDSDNVFVILQTTF